MGTSYVYDGQNQRVKLVEPAGTTYFIYGADGAVLAEYSTAPLTGPGGRQYLTSDWLGSTRLTTDSTGNVTTRRDYFPFGKSVEGSIGSRGAVYESVTPSAQLFTGKERDAETGLDYFGARYMSAAQGRFGSAGLVP